MLHNEYSQTRNTNTIQKIIHAFGPLGYLMIGNFSGLVMAVGFPRFFPFWYVIHASKYKNKAVES